MHKQQRAFCLYVRELFPEFFEGQSVVDFGSLDINGSNRDLFRGGEYVGIDIGAGRNVDVVCRAHEYCPARPVDVVISTEMLEHDEHWRKSLRHAHTILREGGLLVFTCAKDPRGEHGTARSSPDDAPFVKEYYRNLSEEDVRGVFDVTEDFAAYEFGGNNSPGDLYFWGVKHGLDMSDVSTS